MNPIKLAHARHLASKKLAGNLGSSYETWRASIPWTDAQIADAVEQWGATTQKDYLRARSQSWADYIRRTGRVSSRAVGIAQYFLIKTCAICGKRADYRDGGQGRCRAHRDTISTQRLASIMAKKAGHDEALAAFHARSREKDSARAHHHATGRLKRGFA